MPAHGAYFAGSLHERKRARLRYLEKREGKTEHADKAVRRPWFFGSLQASCKFHTAIQVEQEKEAHQGAEAA